MRGGRGAPARRARRARRRAADRRDPADGPRRAARRVGRRPGRRPRRPPRRRVRRRPPARRDVDPARRAGGTDSPRSPPTSKSSPTAAAATACCPISPCASSPSTASTPASPPTGCSSGTADGVPTTTANHDRRRRAATTAPATGTTATNRVGDEHVSWFQSPPDDVARTHRRARRRSVDARSSTSAAAAPDSSTSSSRRGFDDITVLDVSATALYIARRAPRRPARRDVAARRRPDVETGHADGVCGTTGPSSTSSPTQPTDATYLRHLAAALTAERVVHHRHVRTRRPGPLLGPPCQPLRPQTPSATRSSPPSPTATIIACAPRDAHHTRPEPPSRSPGSPAPSLRDDRMVTVEGAGGARPFRRPLPGGTRRRRPRDRTARHRRRLGCERLHDDRPGRRPRQSASSEPR